MRSLPAPDKRLAILVATLVVAAGLTIFANGKETAANPAALTGTKTGKPALTVAPITAQRLDMPQRLAAHGNIAAWQEVIIGAEVGGFRLREVFVNVGDTVRKGQLLAEISSEIASADLAESKARVAEARAQLDEAIANADRARRVRDATQASQSGAMSAQLIQQYLSAENAARARLEAAEARAAAEEIRHSRLRIVAPDRGVISARAAIPGALAAPGQELFRMVRDSRLEWRAEVTAAELGRLGIGQRASIVTPAGKEIVGRLRALAPTVDAQTRMGLVYVDLPAEAMAMGARAGMFARGEFELGKPGDLGDRGSSATLSLPTSAVVQRDGFSYVFRIEAGDTNLRKVTQQKISVGRRAGERIEITGGLDTATGVVASGAGFLADGDTVTVVDAPSRLR